MNLSVQHQIDGVITMAGRMLMIRERQSRDLLDLPFWFQRRFLDHNVVITVHDYGRALYEPPPIESTER